MINQSIIRIALLAAIGVGAPLVANADFIIEYPPAKPEPEPVIEVEPAEEVVALITPDNAVLLLDNSYRYLIEYGKGEADSVMGSVKNMPLAGALNLLIPDGWKVAAHKDVAVADVAIDWVDGQTWTEVLEQAGRDNHLVFEVDWERKEVMITNGGDVGLFANAMDSRIPANAGQEADSDAPLYSFSIRAGDNLRNVVTRMANAYGFSRALIDLVQGSRDPVHSVSKKSMEIKGRSIEELGAELSSVFMDMGKFTLAVAEDKSSRAIVLTNQNYSPWDELKVFEVQASNLQQNAVALAEMYGWSVPRDYWLMDVEYNVPVAHSLITKDILHGFGRLFDPYPVQAQLVDSTQKVVFVKRSHKQSRPVK